MLLDLGLNRLLKKNDHEQRTNKSKHCENSFNFFKGENLRDSMRLQDLATETCADHHPRLLARSGIELILCRMTALQ